MIVGHDGRTIVESHIRLSEECNTYRVSIFVAKFRALLAENPIETTESVQ